MNILSTESCMAQLRITSFELECELLDPHYSSLVALSYSAKTAPGEDSRDLSIACTLPGFDVQLWEMSNCDKPVPRLRYQEHHDEITALAWSPDQQLMASASEDRTVRIWDVETGTTRLLYTEQPVIRALSWSPDGRLLATGSEDNHISLLHTTHLEARSIDTGQLTGNYGIDAIAWSPGGSKFASVGDDNQVYLWDATSGANLLCYAGHEDYWVLNLAWSPDEKYIASGADNIHVWDVETGVCQVIYLQHNTTEYWIDQIAWSPDGRFIASTSTDNVLHIWHPPQKTPLYVYAHPYKAGQLEGLTANALAWSKTLQKPEMTSQQLAIGSCNRTVSLIDILEEEEERS
ncbi:hypothetical protein KDW_18110 [Dictyobacter vulcani]|uniref:Translation initiation factor beta propellor-like domain-containing protein n=1 Tax=Dictyobacter vulcani TaxID=2607529 RepID=A0A5J4KND7_9CHLR|nr:WD40 repeat domain-containing protein [Dictyobacter vulcani]GER87649.1 hypothetical protein KDW_18110 [Dictyobacter vulcani]